MARDKGCSIPGCTAPALWCQVHHLTTGNHGGTTDINDLAMVCRFHHRHIEDWTGPPLLDPHQNPRANHAYDPIPQK